MAFDTSCDDDLGNFFYSIPPQFGIIKFPGKGYRLLDFREAECKKFELTIPMEYSSVIWDGKYFVFVNSSNRNAIYLDPEAPESPIPVPVRRPAILDRKPQDAPFDSAIVKNQDGYGIADIQSGVRVVTPKESYRRLRRGGDAVFLNEKNELISDDGVVQTRITREEDWNNNLFVMRQTEGSRVLYDSGILPKKGYSRDIRISGSGRYTVHEDMDGNLTYYDHDQNNLDPVPIPSQADYLSWSAHRFADVVITSGSDGLSLFSLDLGGFLFHDADDLAIDSSLKIAIARRGDSLIFYDLVNGKPILTVVNSQGLDTAIKISSDEKRIYVLQGVLDNFQGIFQVYDKNTMTSQGEHILDMNDPSLPRFWESYDLEKKTIWDRTGESKTSDWPVQYYGTYSDQIRTKTHLFGSTLTYSGPGEDDLSIIGIFRCDLNQGMRWLISSDPHKFGALQGDHVRYIDRKAYAFAMTRNESFVGGEIKVNTTRTFLLIHTDSRSTDFFRYVLIHSDGNTRDITDIIPSGFEVTDVNGDYFVLSNPETGEIKFLDPRAAFENQTHSDLQTQEQERILQFWDQAIWQEDESGKSLVEQIVGLAQPAYLGLVGNEGLPEGERTGEEDLLKGYRPDVENAIGELIFQIYQDQEEDIRQLFLNFIAENPNGLDLEKWRATVRRVPLRCSVFADKLNSGRAGLSSYVRSIRSKLIQTDSSFQTKFYENLFSGLFQIAANREIHAQSFDPKIFQTLGLGYIPQNQEQIADIGTVIAFWELLLQNRASWPLASKILTFFHKAELSDPQRHGILMKQIRKILDLKGSYQTKVVKQILDAFEDVKEKDLEKSLSPDKKNLYKLSGETRVFVSFFTNIRGVNLVREKEESEILDPKGRDLPFPPENVFLSQIAALEKKRPKSGRWDIVMSLQYLRDHLLNLPEENSRVEQDILRKINSNTESGAYIREATQNAKDATLGRIGKLVVDFYIQVKNGKREYVEEISDNGTGALQEVALLLKKSTKEAGSQIDLAGYFGSGKYALFQGTDRVEFLTRNGERATLFRYAVERNESGEVARLILTGIREVKDERVSQGFTLRRIKDAEKTLPDLEQLIAQENWARFAGLAQDENFTIYFKDHEGNEIPLKIDPVLLSQVEFEIDRVRPKHKGEKVKGAIRVWETKGLP
ncbi:MAG: hypothetical protein HY610_04315, partial [Elusimicrobia bacterium]|nr:hypothetical protein [Elusimicrobiota bacterium]